MSVSLPSAWRGTDSRATQQPRSKVSGSRRFSFEHCRPYAAICSGVAAFWLGANAELSFNVSDNGGVILWGVLSAVGAGFAVFWGLRSWWPDLEAEREAADARARAEMEERQRRFTAAAERIQVLKAERLRLSKAKKSCEAVDKELKALTNLLLAGA